MFVCNNNYGRRMHWATKQIGTIGHINSNCFDLIVVASYIKTGRVLVYFNQMCDVTIGIVKSKMMRGEKCNEESLGDINGILFD